MFIVVVVLVVGVVFCQQCNFDEQLRGCEFLQKLGVYQDEVLFNGHIISVSAIKLSSSDSLLA